MSNNNWHPNNGWFADNFEIPEIEIPEIEIPDVEIPEIEIPDFDFPDIEIPEIEIPDFDFPDIDIPSVIDIFGDVSGNFTGTEGNDTIVAAGLNGVIDDTLQGLQGDDIIVGGEGNDVILGGEGNDILSGAAANIISDTRTVNVVISGGGGLYGQDTLTGSQGADRFILGGSGSSDNIQIDSDFIIEGDSTPNNYYDAAGNDDYALITDFNQSEDIIQLDGSRNDYILGASPTGLPSGLGIYQSEELIAIVQGDTDLSLSADYFQDSIV